MYYSERGSCHRLTCVEEVRVGQGMDVCLADPSEAGTLEECLESEFVRCLVRQAGLVIMGAKPAAIFGFHARAWRRFRDSHQRRRLMRQLLSVYASRLAQDGVRLVWLAERPEGPMLLAWRPDRVASLLGDARSREFLVRAGLPSDGAETLVSALVGRLRAYYAGRRDFPHELGLVLGYPVEDVEGFMADGGRNAVACGRWKVYGDPAVARRRFEELGRAERRCRQLYAEGVPVRELLRMGKA